MHKDENFDSMEIIEDLNIEEQDPSNLDMKPFESKEKVNIEKESFDKDNLLSTYFTSIRKFPLLTSEQERDYGTKAKEGDKAAFDIMVTSNLRLVIKIAMEYKSRGVQIIDLIEEGNLGLIHAVKKFEPNRGYRFSTYATWWIRQSVEQAIMRQSRIVRLPIYVIKELNTILRAQKLLQQKNQEVPVTVKLIAEYTNKDEEDIRAMLSFNENAIPLDLNINSNSEDKEISLLDVIADDNSISPNSYVNNLELTSIIQEWFETLNEKQQIVILSRYGLKENEIRTLDDISKDLNLTKERVRQIQNECLNILKKILIKYGFNKTNYNS